MPVAGRLHIDFGILPVNEERQRNIFKFVLKRNKQRRCALITPLRCSCARGAALRWIRPFSQAAQRSCAVSISAFFRRSMRPHRQRRQTPRCSEDASGHYKIWIGTLKKKCFAHIIKLAARRDKEGWYRPREAHSYLSRTHRQALNCFRLICIRR